MKYLVVYEKSQRGWGAFVPDLPGLGVAAKKFNEVQVLIHEGIDFHLKGMREKAKSQRPRAKGQKLIARS